MPLRKTKDLTPKPTKYKRITYRSRLEARWAVCLDHATNVRRFSYEPKHIDLGGGETYLPDFLIYRTRKTPTRFWLEVKPAKISEDYVKFIRNAARKSPIPLLLAIGSFYQEQIPKLYWTSNLYEDVDFRTIFTPYPQCTNAAKSHRFDLE